MNTYEVPPIRQGLDSFSLVALVLIAFGGWVLFRDIRSTQASGLEAVEGSGNQLVQLDAKSVEDYQETKSELETPANVIDDHLIAAPYDQYILTQGPHGFSYGHMAIDLTAGKGGIIKSPIDGEVSALYVDQYDNPTLVIENDSYQITMLHGKYKVEVGERVKIGQMVGRESNLGYTTDIWGRSCRNRECGYHTHLNIFDKRIGSNINPLDVIE
jgi:hypothetical protein